MIAFLAYRLEVCYKQHFFISLARIGKYNGYASIMMYEKNYFFSIFD
jgi:hypothetical protein